MQHDQGYYEESKLGKTYDVKLLKRLFPFTQPYRFLLFGSIGLVLLITCLDLALPYITKIAIDRYIVPMTNVIAAGNGADNRTKERVIRVGLADRQKRALVESYKGLFKIEGNTAQISYSKLSGIKKADLAVLRKDDVRGITVISAVFLALVIISFILSFVQK